MAQQAQITSVEAIESFRASLILYLSKARPVLEEVSADVLRTRLWLQNDQRQRWENELRLCNRRLEEAKAELLNAKISQFQQSTTLPHMAVQRAQQAVKEVEAKLAVLKKWDREMENRTDPLTKQVEQLHGFLTTDMTRAVAHLAQIVKTLDAYSDVLSPAGSAASTAAPGREPENTPAQASDDPGEKGSPA
jgi:chromosome segregation ATPase